jgi:hypothetical protein
VAIGLGRWAPGAAAAVGVLLLLSLIGLQIPKALGAPWIGAQWTNPCKALALLGGVIVLANHGLANSLPEIEASSGLARWFRRLRPLGAPFFCLFLILGGIQHFVYADFVVKLIPE